MMIYNRRINTKKKSFINVVFIAILCLVMLPLSSMSTFAVEENPAEKTINITYLAGDRAIGDPITKEQEYDQPLDRVLALDFGAGGTGEWTVPSKKDVYETAFAGWKLNKINGVTVTGNYYYPDNDYLYFSDQPFVGKTINSIEVQAVWGKTIYIRDQYNMVDITDVYGINDTENSDGAPGDISIASINWDKSKTFASDMNDGATPEKPLATIAAAYGKLKSSVGGKIVIVNHYTIQASSDYYYTKNTSGKTENFKSTNSVYSENWGKNLGIYGVVTLTGEGHGSGIQAIENKKVAVPEGTDENLKKYYQNGSLYTNITRGNGVTADNKAYTALNIDISIGVDTIIENASSHFFRDTYNTNGTRSSADAGMTTTGESRLLIEDTFDLYLRSSNEATKGKSITNWGYTNTTENGTVLEPLSKWSSLSISGSPTSGKNVYINVRCNAIKKIMGNNTTASVNNIHINGRNTEFISGSYEMGGDTRINRIDIYAEGAKEVMPITFAGSGDKKVVKSINGGKVDVNIATYGTTATGSIYGGGYTGLQYANVARLYANVTITVKEGNVTNLYGGGNYTSLLLLGDVNINVEGGKVNNLYGGGQGGFVGTNGERSKINIDISGGTIDNIYGGGAGGTVVTGGQVGPGGQEYNFDDKPYIYQSDLAANNAYYLNDTMLSLRESTTIIDGQPVGKYPIVESYTQQHDTPIAMNRGYWSFTLADSIVCGDIQINLKSGAKITKDVYGGGKSGAVKGKTTINVEEGASVGGDVYGGGFGNDGKIEGVKETIGTKIELVWVGGVETTTQALTQEKIKVAAEKTGTAYSNCESVITKAVRDKFPRYTTHFLLKTEIEKNGSGLQVDGETQIFAEVMNKMGLVEGDTNITINGGTVSGNIYGGSYGITAIVDGNTNITINGGTVKKDVFGGGNQATVKKDTNVTVTGGTVEQSIYGGGARGNISGNSKVKMTNGIVNGTVFGGGQGINAENNRVGADTTGNVDVTISGGTVTKDVYGGGDILGTIKGTVSVTVENGTVGDVYGGGNKAKYPGTPTVKLLGGTVTNVYGGGNKATVKSTDVLLKRVKVKNNIYGGGNVGEVEEGTCVSYQSGETAGNVFGGSNQAKVHGDAIVNIGLLAVDPTANTDSLMMQDNILIKGTVFGGGDTTAGGNTFNENDPYVLGDTTVKVIATGYDQIDRPTFDIKGSILGDGNMCVTRGTKQVFITDYGKLDNAKPIVSIQRVTKADIKNSFLQLEGATDSANADTTLAYSINRANEINLIDGSRVWLKNNVNLLLELNSYNQDKTLVTATQSTEEDKADIYTPSCENYVFINQGKFAELRQSEDLSVIGFGAVKGITMLGIYDATNPETKTFTKNIYVKGSNDSKDLTNTTNGFVTAEDCKFSVIESSDEGGTSTETSTIEAKKYSLIQPTTDNETYRQWTLGGTTANMRFDLIASNRSLYGKAQEKASLWVADGNKYVFYTSNDPSGNEGALTAKSLVAGENFNFVIPGELDHLTGEAIDNTFAIEVSNGGRGWIKKEEPMYLIGNTQSPKDLKLVNAAGQPTSSNSWKTTVDATVRPSVKVRIMNKFGVTKTDENNAFELGVEANSIRQNMDGSYSEDGKIIMIISGKRDTTAGELATYNVTGDLGKNYDICLTKASAANLNVKKNSAVSLQFERKLADMETNGKSYLLHFGRRMSGENRIEKKGLPVGTTILMVDKNATTPKYYYYKVAGDETSVDLETFKQSGTDTAYSIVDTNGREDYIFIFDFKNSETTSETFNLGDSGSNYMEIYTSLEKKDGLGNSIAGAEVDSTDDVDQKGAFRVYNEESTYSLIAEQSRVNGSYSPIEHIGLNLENKITGTTMGTDTVAKDTGMGAVIKLYKKNDGETTTWTKQDIPNGTRILSNEKYYYGAGNTIVVKLTDSIVATKASMKFEQSTIKPLETGDYKFVISLVGGHVLQYTGDQGKLASTTTEELAFTIKKDPDYVVGLTLPQGQSRLVYNGQDNTLNVEANYFTDNTGIITEVDLLTHVNKKENGKYSTSKEEWGSTRQNTLVVDPESNDTSKVMVAIDIPKDTPVGTYRIVLTMRTQGIITGKEVSRASYNIIVAEAKTSLLQKFQYTVNELLN